MFCLLIRWIAGNCACSPHGIPHADKLFGMLSGRKAFCLPIWTPMQSIRSCFLLSSQFPVCHTCAKSRILYAAVHWSCLCAFLQKCENRCFNWRFSRKKSNLHWRFLRNAGDVSRKTSWLGENNPAICWICILWWKWKIVYLQMSSFSGLFKETSRLASFISWISCSEVGK